MMVSGRWNAEVDNEDRAHRSWPQNVGGRRESGLIGMRGGRPRNEARRDKRDAAIPQREGDRWNRRERADKRSRVERLSALGFGGHSRTELKALGRRLERAKDDDEQNVQYEDHSRGSIQGRI